MKWPTRKELVDAITWWGIRVAIFVVVTIMATFAALSVFSLLK